MPLGWAFLFLSGEGVERRCRAKSRPDRFSGFFGDRFDQFCAWPSALWIVRCHRVWGGLRCGPFDASWLAPVFFKPEDAGQLLDWFTLIVDPAGRMPFYFYDIPAMTSVRIETH